MSARFETYIAWRYFRAKRKTHFIALFNRLSIIGVMLGVAVLIITLSVMNGFQKEVRDRIVGVTAHITVYSLRDNGISNPESLIAVIKTIPGVVDAVPFILGKAAIASKNQNDGVFIRGVDPADEARITSTSRNMIQGSFDFSPDERDSLPGIVLGRTLAGRMEVGVGSPFFVFSMPKGQFSIARFTPRVSRFRVSGIFETGLDDFDAGLAYVGVPVAQEIFSLPGAYSGVQVRVVDALQASEISRQIQDKLRLPYTAESWADMNKNLFAWMKIEKWGLFLLLSMIIAVSAFNIISMLIMVVLEKTRDIGVMRSMGATRQSILRIFVANGMFVGVIGTAIGTVAGLALCYIQIHYRLISLPPDVYLINTLPIRVLLPDVLLVMAAGIGISFLSTLYPAWYAAKLTPVEAIRHE